MSERVKAENSQENFENRNNGEKGNFYPTRFQNYYRARVIEIRGYWLRSR